MSTIRDGAVQCQSCYKPVTGYEHRASFAFVQGERIQASEGALLSCGCEILDYSLEWDRVVGEYAVNMVDNFNQKVVVTFKDKGKNNELWYGKDEDEE